MFFGMIVGKALFEGILLKAQFAKPFLNSIVNKTNTVDDLIALDKDLYNNLMYLKYYEVKIYINSWNRGMQRT